MIAQHFCLDKKITSEVDENDASYVRVQYITVGIGVNESQKIIEATQSSKFKRCRPEKGGRGKLTCVGSFYQLDFWMVKHHARFYAEQFILELAFTHGKQQQ